MTEAIMRQKHVPYDQKIRSSKLLMLQNKAESQCWN